MQPEMFPTLKTALYETLSPSDEASNEALPGLDRVLRKRRRDEFDTEETYTDVEGLGSSQDNELDSLFDI